MSYSTVHDNYGVYVDGRFASPGQWVVHGVVTYRPGPQVSSKADQESEARLDLMVGIARESQRGRAAGARNVHVFIEGDKELAGLFAVKMVIPPWRASEMKSSPYRLRFRTTNR
jgi:hypothetical protein